MRNQLLWLHRWTAIILTPLFLLLICSGMVLAFKPILGSTAKQNFDTAVDSQALIALLKKVDPQNSANSLQRIDENEWRVSGKGRFNIASLSPVNSSQSTLSSHNLFKTVEHFHKSLAIGAGWLIKAAAWAMCIIMLVGFSLGWPHFRNTLIGWHLTLGWFAPLLLLLPLTAVLMTLHVGQPAIPPVTKGPPQSLLQALQQAEKTYDLSTLSQVRRFRGGSVLLQGQDKTLLSNTSGIRLLGNNWPKTLHTGSWGKGLGGGLNLLLAVMLLALTLTGFTSWWRRWRSRQAAEFQAGAKLLIVYASQTGTAQRLARTTANSLDVAADFGAIEQFAPERWRMYPCVLILCSSTGEGELPEHARKWVSRLNASSLHGVRYSLLALGDRQYKNFCGGAIRLDAALSAAGAVAETEKTKVDGAPDQVWREWLGAQAARHGWQFSPESSEQPDCQAILLERMRLDCSDDLCHQAYSLLVRVPSTVNFEPGDLIEFQPATGIRRCYSIGSSSRLTPGRIRLTLGLVRFIDNNGYERTGVGSGDLCLNWEVGQSRDVRIVSHTPFHLPRDTKTPLILMATGCGIAPLMGFIEQRAALPPRQRGAIWMLYGNRNRTSDYLYETQLRKWQEEGVIEIIDTTFSRDEKGPKYITDLLAHSGRRLLEWMQNRAEVYVCGRASTLGKSIEPALTHALTDGGLSAQTADGLMRDWKRSQRLHFDLFG